MTNSSAEIVQQINDFLVQGAISKAYELNSNFWAQGGEISNTDMVTYIDILLNMGEVDRAGILLKEAIEHPRQYDNFIEVMIKYLILAPKLVLLKQLGEYPKIYELNPQLFDWAKQTVDQRIVLEYSILIKTAHKNLIGKILRFGYEINNEILDIDFYTNENESNNNITTKKITREINKQFIRRGLEIPNKMNLNIFSLESFGN